MYRKWWIFYDYLLISIGEREKDRMANEKTDVKERKDVLIDTDNRRI